MPANPLQSSSVDPARDAWSGQHISGSARVQLGNYYNSSTSNAYYYGGSSNSSSSSNSFFARRKRNKELGQAAGQGGTKRVRALLQSGADVDYRYGDQGETALHLAARGGHDACVELLLEAGSAVNALTEGKEAKTTALYLAAERGHTSVVRTLLATDGIAIDGHGPLGSPLCAATGYGSVTCVELLLRAGSAVNGRLNARIGTGDERSALYMAAEYGCTAIVRMLLATEGISIDGHGPRGSPLRVATLKGHLDVVKLLVEGRADPEWELGDIPQYLAQANAAVLARMLYCRKYDEDYLGELLLNTASEGSVACVKLLLNHGARISQYYTVWTVKCVNAEIFRILLERCDMSQSWKQRAIYYAAVYGKPDILQVLLDHGASPNPDDEDSFNGPPLACAARHGRLKCVQLLIAAGADVTRRCDGKTALQRAREFKRSFPEDKDRYDAVIAYLENAEAQQAAQDSAVT